MKSLKSSAISAGIALVASTTPLAAQESGAESATALEEIIVTADKLNAVAISDSPIAVSAFGQEAIDEMGASELVDFLQLAPGVGIIENSPGQNFIQIRGASSNFGDATVGFYLDDLPFTLLNNTQLPSATSFDLERVEVLRGPQGTLYGAGSLGGTVRVLTKKPDLENFSGNARVSGSSISDGGETFTGGGVLNVPLVEGVLGARVAVSYTDAGGFIDSSGTGDDEVNEGEVANFRGKLRWLPTDNFEANLSAWISKNEFDSSGWSTAGTDFDLTLPFLLPVDSNYDLFNGTLSWDVGDINIFSATSYIDYELFQVVDLSALGFPLTSDITQDVFSQEVRITSAGESRFSWMVGGFYMEADEIANNTLTPDNPLVGTLLLTPEVSASNFRSEQWSLFGQAQYELVPNSLTASLGLRYFEDERDDIESATTALVLFSVLGLDRERSESYDDVSPRFNLSYTPSDDVLIYGTISKGFRSGNIQPALGLIQGFPSAPNSIEEENLWSYELGTKITGLDGQLYTELAVYYNDWTDVQGTSAGGFFVNAGDAEAYGIDFLFDYSPAGAPGLSLQLSGNWNDTTYTDIDPSVPGLSEGDRVDLVPELTLNASASYGWSISDGLLGSLYLGAQYTDARENRGTGLELFGDEITMVTGRLGISSGAYDLYLFVENALDEDGSISPNINRPFEVLRPQPRTVGAEIRLQF